MEAEISSEDTTNRLVSLVIGQNIGVSESLRRLAAGTDGGEPTRISRTQADRILRDARRDTHDRADTRTVAARMLRLVSSELAVVEAEQGPKDLERLAKLAGILGTIERLRPKADPQGEVGLLSLRDQGTNSTEPEGLHDLRTAEG